MMAMTFLSMFLPLPLLHVTKYLSYDPSVNPLIKYRYVPVPVEPEGEHASNLKTASVSSATVSPRKS